MRDRRYNDNGNAPAGQGDEKKGRVPLCGTRPYEFNCEEPAGRRRYEKRPAAACTARSGCATKD